MVKITGSTYEAKDYLKKAGYNYDATTKAWYGDSRQAFDELIAKWRRPGYGVAWAKLADKLCLEDEGV
jgi:uncharacterized protein YukE